eukprot:CAMPEP_0172488258 /NCGR_PEP_ID=MMETSP1066-20121228/17710_1 /TAXON_ID=671091 /ORGANISM="Coscinodiscus wailesii, Strain CCMP2513" /LENGTH=67 /DNA_ID=CAMNT_0013255373 /DNA_START=82 /DNA_END=285 /DNA_ORIENTATION=+
MIEWEEVDINRLEIISQKVIVEVQALKSEYKGRIMAIETEANVEKKELCVELLEQMGTKSLKLEKER